MIIEITALAFAFEPLGRQAKRGDKAFLVF